MSPMTSTIPTRRPVWIALTLLATALSTGAPMATADGCLVAHHAGHAATGNLNPLAWWEWTLVVEGVKTLSYRAPHGGYTVVDVCYDWAVYSEMYTNIVGPGETWFECVGGGVSRATWNGVPAQGLGCSTSVEGPFGGRCAVRGIVALRPLGSTFEQAIRDIEKLGGIPLPPGLPAHETTGDLIASWYIEGQNVRADQPFFAHCEEF